MTKTTKNAKPSNRTTKLLEKNIKSLRENMGGMSMDKFIRTTIETLMNIEKGEHVEKVNNSKVNKKSQ